MGHVALPQFEAMMAEVLLLRGELAAAEAHLTDAIEFARSHEDRYFDAEARRLLASCRCQRGALSEASVGLRYAIEVARTQGAAIFELRAALTLAQLDPREGRTATRSALDRIGEPEAWPEVAAAHDLLR